MFFHLWRNNMMRRYDMINVKIDLSGFRTPSCIFHATRLSCVTLSKTIHAWKSHLTLDSNVKSIGPSKPSSKIITVIIKQNIQKLKMSSGDWDSSSDQGWKFYRKKLLSHFLRCSLNLQHWTATILNFHTDHTPTKPKTLCKAWVYLELPTLRTWFPP